MSIRVKEENQELMLLVLEHSISGSSMKDLQNELDMIKVVMLVEAQFGVTFSVSEPFEKEKLVAIHFLVDSIHPRSRVTVWRSSSLSRYSTVRAAAGSLRPQRFNALALGWKS